MHSFKTRSCLLLLLAVFFFSCGHLLAQQAVATVPPGLIHMDNVEAWTITDPTVNQPETDYPQITFMPGDYIYVLANGCDQTGGSGKTWKLYVDPQGPNADRLYHGLICINGLTNGYQRLINFGLGSEHQIPVSTSANNLHLHLGFEDDNYSDNGYWGHDNGTGNQCLGLSGANVTIAVRRGGSVPFDPAILTGIAPNNFYAYGTWQFQNFNTSTLSFDSYKDSFDLSWVDYLNPFTYVLYWAADGLASGGNCFGMGLLADATENEWEVGNVHEYLWPTYPQNDPVSYSINVAHWKQLSTAWLFNYAAHIFDHNLTTVQRIQNDLNNNIYGVLAMTQGHAIVPYQVVSKPNNTYWIYTYDPNSPYTPGAAPGSVVTIVGNSQWSFYFGLDPDNNNQPTTFTQDTGSLVYGSYSRSDEWNSTPIADLAEMVFFVFAGNTNVVQVTDSRGHTLFERPNVDGKARLNMTSNGLANDLAKVPAFGQSAAGGTGQPFGYRGAKFQIAALAGETPAMTKLRTTYLQQYQADYDNSKQIYYLANKSLKGLTFQVTSPTGKPVKMMMGGNSKFLEIQSSPSDKSSVIQPNILVNDVSDFSQGVQVSDPTGVVQQVGFTYGEYQKDVQQYQIQQATGLSFSTTKVKVVPVLHLPIRILSNGAATTVSVKTTTVDSTGKRTIKAPVKLTPELLK